MKIIIIFVAMVLLFGLTTSGSVCEEIPSCSDKDVVNSGEVIEATFLPTEDTKVVCPCSSASFSVSAIDIDEYSDPHDCLATLTYTWTDSQGGSGNAQSYTFIPLTAGTHTVKCIVSDPDDDGDDEDHPEKTWTIYAVEVTMINPSGNPTNSAEAEEGVNEFTFTGDNPGVCEIDCLATISPSNEETLAWAEQNVSWGISPGIEGSTMTWVDDQGQTADNKGLAVTIRFTGMPEHNAAFGSKTVTLTACSPDPSPIEVFFGREDTNSNQQGVHNWYPYWAETAAYAGGLSYHPYKPSAETVYGGNGQWIAYLGYNSDEDAVIPDGPESVKDKLFESINIFAWRCRHESRHVVTNTSWYPTGYDSGTDADDDGMPDNVESTFGSSEGGPFDDENRDTDDDDLDDVEDYVCWTQSAWGQHDGDGYDWANPGCQH